MTLEKVQNILADQFEVAAAAIIKYMITHGISIPDEDATELMTVGKIVEYIEAKL